MQKDYDFLDLVYNFTYDYGEPGGTSYTPECPVNYSEIEKARRIFSGHDPFGIEQFRGTYEL